MHTAHIVRSQLVPNLEGFGIQLGDRVLVQGQFPGSVKYIGDLDSRYPIDELYVGVKLDDPVGDTDGTYLGKRFFRSPKAHGVIVPIHHIHILVSRQGSRRGRTNLKHPQQSRVRPRMYSQTSSDSNDTISVAVPDKVSPPCDEETADSEVSYAHGKEKQVLDVEKMNAETVRNFQEMLREIGRSCSKGKKTKRQRVQGKKTKAVTSSSKFEELVKEMLTAMKLYEAPVVHRNRVSVATLPVRHDANLDEKETASKGKEINAGADFKGEQKRLQEMVNPRRSSNDEKKTGAVQTKKVNRATSPGINQERLIAQATSPGIDQERSSAQSYEEETDTDLLKVSNEATWGSTKDTHSSEAMQPGKVHTDHLMVYDQRMPQIELNHSSECSTTAEQAIAQILREKISSSDCDRAGDHRMPQAAYEDDEYLTAELRQFLRKLYHAYASSKNTDNSGTAKAVKSGSPPFEEGLCICSHHCHHDGLVKSTSEHSSLMYMNAPVMVLNNLKRELGRSLSTTDVTSTTLSFDAESEMDSTSVPSQGVGARPESVQSDSRALMSGLRDSLPKSPSSEIRGMRNIKKWTNTWGGGEKGFRMALTFQKLQDATKKGKKEVEWQEELTGGVEDPEFAERKRAIKLLKEEIVQVSKMAVYAEEQIERRLSNVKLTSAYKSVDELKEKIKELRKKNSETFEKIRRHPMAANNEEYIKNTIARITRDLNKGMDN